MKNWLIRLLQVFTKWMMSKKEFFANYLEGLLSNFHKPARVGSELKSTFYWSEIRQQARVKC